MPHRNTRKSFTAKKNTRKAGQNVFDVDITISQSLGLFKASLEWFSQMKCCF